MLVATESVTKLMPFVGSPGRTSSPGAERFFDGAPADEHQQRERHQWSHALIES